MNERLRLETLIARDGMGAAGEWARRAADVYRRSISDPTHYASQPDKKSLFEASIAELETFAHTGVIN